MDTIYTRIKQLREQLGISQEELAEKVGYKEKSAISHIEKGRKDIPQSKIVAFADALDTTPSYLMDGYDVDVMYKEITNMNRMDQMLLMNRLLKYFDLIKENNQ